MQTVSAGFTTAAAAPVNQPNFGVLVSWLKNFNASATFFTIGVSAIGGPDPLKGSTSTVTLFDKYDYMVENDQVNNLTIERTVSTIPIGIMSAQLDLELDNTTKRYMPGFDATIGNYIKPGRPVKVNAGFGLEVVQQFVGYTGRPKISLGKRKFNVHAFDAMEFLNKFESSLAMQVNITAKDAIALLLAEAGFSASQYVLEDSLQFPIAFLAPSGQKTGPLIQWLCEAEGALFFFDEAGIGRFWNRLHFDLNSTAIGTLNYSNLLDLQFADTPIINHVRVTAKPRAVTANQLIYRLSQPFVVQPGEVLRYVINFTDDDGPLPATTIDTPLYVDNQITSFYKTNDKQDGTGSTLSTAISVTYYGSLGTGAIVEFTSTATVPVYITDLQIYGTPAKVVTTYQQEYKDQVSIDDNGLNPDNSGVIMDVVNDYIQDATTAYVYAFNIVNQFAKTSKQLIGVPFGNPAWQFGDVFNVTIADTGLTYKMVMLGNKLNMDRTTAISQSMTLEERVFRSYFTIGISAIGGVDALHA